MGSHLQVPFFGTAFVLMLATSDPLPTSLTPRQARMSPAMEGARNSLLSSSVPNLARAGTAMSVGYVVCVCYITLLVAPYT